MASDEENAAQIIADKMENIMQRLGIFIIWSTKTLVVGMLISGRLANQRSRVRLRMPPIIDTEKDEAREIVDRIVGF